jgi:hypothetical protein
VLVKQADIFPETVPYQGFWPPKARKAGESSI